MNVYINTKTNVFLLCFSMASDYHSVGLRLLLGHVDCWVAGPCCCRHGLSQVRSLHLNLIWNTVWVQILIQPMAFQDFSTKEVEYHCSDENFFFFYGFTRTSIDSGLILLIWNMNYMSFIGATFFIGECPSATLFFIIGECPRTVTFHSVC